MRALLFDLDGTLISNSMETFLPPYFAALTKKLAPLVPPAPLIAQLRASTQVMMANQDPARTNAQVFADDFFPRLGLARERLLPLLDDFYAREYRALRVYVQPIAPARPLIERALARGYRVVIATAPVFPRAAIEQRLEWGNLADLPYALVTDYETMHASKPNPAYYREIAARIGCAPTECVMVGNDVEMDIVPARRVGMKTFWVTDAGGVPTEAPADWCGTLAAFAELLERGEFASA